MVPERITFMVLMSWFMILVSLSWCSREVLVLDFVGSGNAKERSEKSMDLELAAPKILILE